MYRSNARFRFGATLGVLLIASIFAGADTQVRWGTAILRQKPEWYASAGRARSPTTSFDGSHPDGGWPKNTDLAAVPPSPEPLAEMLGRGGGRNHRQRSNHHADALSRPDGAGDARQPVPRKFRLRRRLSARRPVSRTAAGRSISRSAKATTRTSPITTTRWSMY